MSLASRLSKIEAAMGRRDEPCPREIVTLLTYYPERGEAEPTVPPDAPICRLCGQAHLIVIALRIIEKKNSMP